MRFFLISTFLLLAIIVFGQNNAQRLTMSTPHDAMWVHLYYLQSEHYDPGQSAEAFVDADSITRVKWAIQLKQIFDGEGLYVQMNLLPKESDYIDTVSQRAYYTPFPNELPQIYLQKTGNRWHYSDETTSVIPSLHKSIYPLGTDLLINLIPASDQKKFLGLELWQYIGILILLLTGFVVYWAVSFLLRFIIRKLSGVQLTLVENFTGFVKKIASIGSILLVVWAIKVLTPLLQLPIKLSAFVQVSLRIALTILIVLLCLRIINLIMAYLRRISDQTASRMDDQLIPILHQIARIIVIVAGILQILRFLEFNITALIAGVSIGGLALALAAQDTVKNFLGSVMIFADRPFQIGDWIEGDGFMGTVVEVGFRSTRIKIPDTSVISVPNGNMANASVVNKGVREYRLFNTSVGLTYDTPPALIEAYIEGVKKIIIEHPEVSNENYYVYFNNMGASSLDIFVRAYMVASTYDDELRIKQSLYLSILRWAEHLGVRFAFPSTTMYVEEFPGQISLMPTYQQSEEDVKAKWDRFYDDFKSRLRRPADES